jgi:membrane associated rhomboid family serine protease
MNPYNSTWNEFKNGILRTNNPVYQFIAVNVIVFIFFGVVNVFFILFKLPYENYISFYNFFSLPAQPTLALERPWTFITYMFMHSGFLHILFNMLWLYWFGRIFLQFQNKQRIVSTYFLGGLAGGLIYILAYQAFPGLQDRIPEFGMVGASASVVAIIAATATLLPNYSVNVIFIGPVKLKYIAIFLIIVDVLSLGGDNAGGHFAHLGGAAYGYLFARQLNAGKDIGNWFTKFINGIQEAFKKQPKQKKSNFRVHVNQENMSKQKQKAKSSANQKQEKSASAKADQEVIDDILDKIAQSGYDSLSDSEKNILFKASGK